MALYHYKALSPKGKHTRGVIDALSEPQAKERLREQGVMITRFWTSTKTPRHARLRGNDLVNFTAQLAQLLRSGLPLYESLLALEEQYREEKYHRVLSSVCDQIKSGIALSKALRSHPQSFNKLYCSMVEAGESTGTLDTILAKLALLFGKQQKLKRQIVASLTYPAVIASFSLIVVFLLLTFAIPSMEELFDDRSVGTFTRLVLDVSHFLSNYWMIYVPLTIIKLIASLLFFKSERGYLYWKKVSLKLPLIKKVVLQSALARFCRTFSTLQEGGLTVIDALRLSSNVTMNPTLEAIFTKAEQGIVEGSSLSQELKDKPPIPKLVVRMLRIGEESGELGSMLGQIAELYEDEVEKSLTRLTSLAQPLILIVMGAIVGLIMLAVLLPLTDVASLL